MRLLDDLRELLNPAHPPPGKATEQSQLEQSQTVREEAEAVIARYLQQERRRGRRIDIAKTLERARNNGARP